MPLHAGVRSILWIVLLLALAGWAPQRAGAADAAVLAAARASITATEAQRHVDVLADDSFEGREAGSRGGRAAGGYVVSHLQRHGLKGAGDDGGYYQSFDAGYRNILAFLPGRDPAARNEVILIGAHYDHVGYGTPTNSYGPTGYIHNGADDNASGVAGLLELIQAFTHLPEPPRRSILFAFWDGEEKGLLGSKHWAANPTIPLAQVKLAVNLDMIGRLRDARLLVYGTRTSYGLRRMISEQNLDERLRLDFNWEMKANSDHHTFFDAGIPTLMFHTDLHDDYHRPRDDSHKINSAGIQDVDRLLFNVAHEAAEGGRRFGFRTASRRETVDHQRSLERAVAPPSPRLGVWWRDETPSKQGVVLTQVMRGSAAERTGLRAGDRVLEFAGAAVESEAELRRLVAISPSPVAARVQRAGSEAPTEMNIHLAGSPIRLGVTWREDHAEPGMVLITSVAPGSPAEQAGIRAGDRVYRIGGQDFANGEAFRALAVSLPGPLELQVERHGRMRTVQAETPPALVADKPMG